MQREQSEQRPRGDWGVARTWNSTSWVEKHKTRIDGQGGGTGTSPGGPKFMENEGKRHDNDTVAR